MSADPTTAPGTLAFVGLGDLGLPMALRVAAGGYRVVGYDLRRIDVESSWPSHFQLMPSLDAALADADAAHICVSYDHEVTRLLDPLVRAAARRLRAVVIHSTVLPSTVTSLAETLSATGVSLVDCPVSGGGREAARAGELTLMVGADQEAFSRYRPVLERLGSTVLRVGEAGAGQVVKLANNVMSHMNRVGYLEAIQLAARYGVSESVVNEVVGHSSGGSWVQEHFSAFDRHGRQHTMAGSAEHGYRYAKDLRYAVEAAHDVSLPLPVTGLVAELAPSMYSARWASDRPSDPRAASAREPDRGV